MSAPFVDWRGPLTEDQIDRAAAEVMDVFNRAAAHRARLIAAHQSVLLPAKATGPKVPMSCKLDPDAFIDLERIAGAENVTLSEILRRALTEYLARYGPPGAKDAGMAAAG